MYIYFILHLRAIYTFDFYYFITKRYSKKANEFFCLAKYMYAAYPLNQNRQLTNGRNVCGAICCHP